MRYLSLQKLRLLTPCADVRVASTQFGLKPKRSSLTSCTTVRVASDYHHQPNQNNRLHHALPCGLLQQNCTKMCDACAD